MKNGWTAALLCGLAACGAASGGCGDDSDPPADADANDDAGADADAEAAADADTTPDVEPDADTAPDVEPDADTAPDVEPEAEVGDDVSDATDGETVSGTTCSESWTCLMGCEGELTCLEGCVAGTCALCHAPLVDTIECMNGADCEMECSSGSGEECEACLMGFCGTLYDACMSCACG